MDDDETLVFKVIVIGNSATGKTSISTRYVLDKFIQDQQATISVQLLVKKIFIHKRSIKINLWDTAGQQRYRSTIKNYYKGAAGVIAVYDITDAQSYLDIEVWIRTIYEILDIEDTVLMIVGNKLDMQSQRSVQSSRPIKDYEDKFGIKCWQVSAKTGQNVQQMFADLIERLYQLNMNCSRLSSDEPDQSKVIYESEIIVDKKQQGPPVNTTKTSAPQKKIENPKCEIPIKVEHDPHPILSKLKRLGHKKGSYKKRESVILSSTPDKKQKHKKCC